MRRDVPLPTCRDGNRWSWFCDRCEVWWAGGGICWMCYGAGRMKGQPVMVNQSWNDTFHSEGAAA